MSKKDEIILKRNLFDIKKQILKIWDKLTEANLEKVNSYQDLVEQLKEAYHISDKQAISKIKKFLTQTFTHPSPSLENLRKILYNQSQDSDD